MKNFRLPNLPKLTNSRRKHIINILESFERTHLVQPERNIPLDLFLRYYFLERKSETKGELSAEDRAQIVEYVYSLTSFKLYLSAISTRPINWGRRLEALESERFEKNIMNGEIPPNIRASFPDDLFQMIIDEYGQEKGYEM
jgi:hypothetical protein